MACRPRSGAGPARFWFEPASARLADGGPRACRVGFHGMARLGRGETEDLMAPYWQQHHGPLPWTELESVLMDEGQWASAPPPMGMLALLAFRVRVYRSLMHQNTSPDDVHGKTGSLRLNSTLTHNMSSPSWHMAAMMQTAQHLLTATDLSASEKRHLAGEIMNLMFTLPPAGPSHENTAWQKWRRAFGQQPLTDRWRLLTTCLRHEHEITWGNGTQHGLWPQMPTSVAANWYESYHDLLEAATTAGLKLTPRQWADHVRLMDHQLSHAMSVGMTFSGSSARPSAAAAAGPILEMLHAQAPDQLSLTTWADRHADVNDIDTAQRLRQAAARSQAATRHIQALSDPPPPLTRPRVRC